MVLGGHGVRNDLEGLYCGVPDAAVLDQAKALQRLQERVGELLPANGWDKLAYRGGDGLEYVVIVVAGLRHERHELVPGALRAERLADAASDLTLRRRASSLSDLSSSMSTAIGYSSLWVFPLLLLSFSVSTSICSAMARYTGQRILSSVVAVDVGKWGRGGKSSRTAAIGQRDRSAFRNRNKQRRQHRQKT